MKKDRKPKFLVTIFFKSGMTVEYEFHVFKTKIDVISKILTRIEWELCDDQGQMLYTDLNSIEHIHSKEL